MLGLFKHSNKIQRIMCPQCFEEQEVAVGAISTYCKNCRGRIDIKKLKQATSQKTNTSSWKPKTKAISCPFCHSLQEVLSNAISAYCKNCHQRIPVQDQKTQTVSDQGKEEIEFSESTSALHQREITCPHCGSAQNVPNTALSSFCSECGNRINLQNYQIRGRFRGELETKGNVYIANDGSVEGNINTGSLIVAGKFEGEIVAERKVELKPTAKLFGKITAPNLVVSPGAIFVGHSHIGK